MIDYEKLKIAHTLTKQLPFSSYSFECWCCTGIESGYFYTLQYEDGAGMTHEYESENIDDLIEILKKFTPPQPKYKVGQEVWFIDCTEKNGPISHGVLRYYEYREHLFGEHKYFSCVGDGYYMPEDCLYPSKEALIKAQIDYWKGLL